MNFFCFFIPLDIHEKCYGNFFCPEDQKPSRNDSLEHEEVDLCIKTDYQGYVYWGEYSLCFAGVLHQEECFRLILSRGANPDLQVRGANPDLQVQCCSKEADH